MKGAELCLDGVGATMLFNPYDCFEDADNDRLVFTYSISDRKTVAAQETKDGLLELTALATGSVSIAINAADPSGARATGAISVAVRDPDKAFDIYPVPATGYIKIRMKEEGTYSVRIASASGSTVHSSRTDISLMQPYRIDLQDIAPGQYHITITGQGKEYRSSFAKI